MRDLAFNTIVKSMQLQLLVFATGHMARCSEIWCSYATIACQYNNSIIQHRTSQFSYVLVITTTVIHKDEYHKWCIVHLYRCRVQLHTIQLCVQPYVQLYVTPLTKGVSRLLKKGGTTFNLKSDLKSLLMWGLIGKCTLIVQRVCQCVHDYCIITTA